MIQSRNWTAIALGVYAMVAIATFGRAASDPDRVCFDKITLEAAKYCPSRVHAAPAIFAGTFWPLYWSWEAWS